jgi:hypothetical protein
MRMTNAFVLRASALLLAACLTANAQTTTATKPAGASAKTGTTSKTQNSNSAAGQSSTAAKSGAATAGDHATEAEVRQMLNAMHVRQTDERLLKQIEPLLQRASNQAAMSNPNLDEADRKFMKDLQDEEESKMLAPEFLDQIVAASVPAYMKNLSAADVRQITAFYNSPAGQHLETALPDISKQAMDSALPLMQQRARDVIGDQQKRISEYMAKKHPQQPAGAAQSGPGGAAGASSGASGASPSTSGTSSTTSTTPGTSTEGAAKSATTTPSNAAPQSSTTPPATGASQPEGPKR